MNQDQEPEPPLVYFLSHQSGYRVIQEKVYLNYINKFDSWKVLSYNKKIIMHKFIKTYRVSCGGGVQDFRVSNNNINDCYHIRSGLPIIFNIYYYENALDLLDIFYGDFGLDVNKIHNKQNILDRLFTANICIPHKKKILDALVKYDINYENNTSYIKRYDDTNGTNYLDYLHDISSLNIKDPGYE